MAVSRSPFNSNALRTGAIGLGGGSGSDDPNQSRVSRMVDILKRDLKQNKNISVGSDDSGLKTTVSTERRKLDKSYDTALAKIATSNLSELGKKRAREAADDLYKKGTTDIDVGGIGNTVREFSKYSPIYWGAKGAGKLIEGVAKVTEPVSRGGQSAIKEFDDLLRSVVGDKASIPWSLAGLLRGLTEPLKTDEQRELDKKLPEPKASFGEWLDQTKSKDFRLVNTGRKFIDGTFDFVADVAFDPTTYITIGAGAGAKAGVQAVSYVGRSGRLALAQRMLTKDMVKQYPELIGKFDEIASVGVGAIPKHIRKAEGLEFGARFAGIPIKGTEAVAGLVSGPSGIGTMSRLAGSSAVRSVGEKITSKAPRLTGVMTPASRAIINKLEIGRGLGVDDSTVLKGIAEYSASKAGKGYKAATYNQFLNESKDLVKEIKNSGLEDKVRRIADNPSLMVTEPNARVRELATRYREWQDGVLNQVNAVRAKFNADYGADMKMINSIDDYGVHHKMTQEAFRLAYGRKGGALSKFFKDADLLPNEIAGNTGAALHRKYTKGEVFMGETLEEGTIDEINRVFRSKYQEQFGEPPSFDFFETDLGVIADSYAYSMAAARSREAYVRRLLDYGTDVAQVINKKMIPDEELVASLNDVYNTLKATRSELNVAVNSGQRLAGKSAKDVLAFAKKALNEKDVASKRLTRESARALDRLIEAETKLAQAYARAGDKSAEQRGMFLQTHAALIEEITNLKGAIQTGRAGEEAAYDALKKLFLAMNPDAKNVPKRATVLYDRITRQMGIRDPQEVAELRKRLNAVQKQISEYDGLDPQELNDLLDIEQSLAREVEGFEYFEDIRQEVYDYAEDGLLFGVVDDIMERRFDPNNEPTLRLLSTKPIVGGDPNLTPDELSAMLNAQLQDPAYVGVHALTKDELFDMRVPENFNAFWSPENGSGDAVSYALRQANMDDGVFREVWNDVLDGNPIDPMFEDIYPAMADLMRFLGDTVPRMEFPDGIVEDSVNTYVFDVLDDSFKAIAMDVGATAEDAVAISRQMMNDFHLAMVAENGATEGLAVLLPSKVFYGSDNGMADGVYSLLLPDNFNYPSRYGQPNLTEEMMDGDIMSPVHFTNSSEFVQKIIDNTYHSDAIDKVDLLEATRTKGEDLATQLMIRGELVAESKKLGGQIGGAKSAGSRRVKAAQKAYDEYLETGLVTVNVAGKTKKVPREEALQILAKKETKLQKAQDALDKRIAATMDSAQFEQLKRRRIRNEERLAMLFDQRRVLEKWNENVGDALRADIEYLQQAIATQPVTGVAGTNSRAWMKRVNDRINNIELLGDTSVARAWERVSTQLGADEARLAELDMVLLPQAEINLGLAKAGINGKIVDDILDGWSALKSTGVQIPKEFEELIVPNVEKLRKLAEQNEWITAYKRYNQIFKTYATMTPGFIVRNAMSATFMNKVAGVSNNAIMDGSKAAIAWHRFGPNKWLDEMGITDIAERELFETAYRAVMAGGRGIQADFASPVIKGGLGERLAENWATKKFMRANEFTEDALRLPMALDTLRKGGTFDEAVYRITRYHFDYTDLSRFDETMKNFIPFWVWTTRNLPLQITEQLLRPGAYNAYNNLKERNPVSADLMMPSWMHEGGAMGLGGRFTLMPDMPMNRLDTTVESFGIPRVIGQANPLVKLPVELLLADKQLALDIPFTDKYEEAKGADRAVAGLAEMLGMAGVPTEGIGRRNAEGDLEINPKISYALGNLMPPIATLQRLAGGALGGKSTYQERQLSSILNFFGVPVREVGPRQERSETIGRQFKLGDLIGQLAERGLIDSND